MNAFTIKDLEKLSGIKAHTIRIWEQRYNLLKPNRTPGNIRYYTNEELKTILNIALLNKCGYKISHIDRMNRDEMLQKILCLEKYEAIRERIVNELIGKMVDLDFEGFERSLDGFISDNGIERTVHQLFFPFLEKIGILWQTGHIHPAQEHLVTNIIRQKLIVAIEAAVPARNSGKTILLYLPEGEQHELGLLFIHYLLKIRGFRVIYLGANVPLKDIAHVVNVIRPHMAFVHLTSGVAGFSVDKFFRFLELKASSIQTVVSGHAVSGYKKKTPGCVLIRRSLGEVVEQLQSL